MIADCIWGSKAGDGGGGTDYGWDIVDYMWVCVCIYI